MKSSYYLRAQNFAAPSVNNDIDLQYQSSQNQDQSLLHNNEELICTNNIMFDSRVCRGNTYATPVLTEDQRRSQGVYERTQKARWSVIERRRLEKLKPKTPPPVHGRVHVMIQTDGTLEEIFGSNDIEIIHDISNECGKHTCKLPPLTSASSSSSSSSSSLEVNDCLNERDNENPRGGNLMETNKTFVNDESRLTQYIARAIYDEAKNDAISRIDHVVSYQSD